MTYKAVYKLNLQRQRTITATTKKSIISKLKKAKVLKFDKSEDRLVRTQKVVKLLVFSKQKNQKEFKKVKSLS